MHGRVVLLIGLEPQLRRAVSAALTGEGAQVFPVKGAEEALRRVFSIRPHLILVAGATLLNDCSFCRQLRQRADAPILAIGGVEPSPSLEMALRQGADDFILQPVRTGELLMRARLLLQGPTTPRRPPHALPLYDDGRLCLDLDARRVSVSERPVRLTPREFEILAYLYRNAGHVLTICQILEDIWGWECRDNPEYVHAYISRLRRKLEPDPTHPIYLISEFGIGYRFERQPAAGA